MIGLLFFGAIGLWIAFAIWLGLKLPKWFKWKWSAFASTLLIPLILLAPVMDEVIAYPQVMSLCAKAKSYEYDEQAAIGQTVSKYASIISSESKTIFPGITVQIVLNAHVTPIAEIPVLKWWSIQPSAGFLKMPAGSSGGSMPLLLPTCSTAAPRAENHQKILKQLKLILVDYQPSK